MNGRITNCVSSFWKKREWMGELQRNLREREREKKNKGENGVGAGANKACCHDLYRNII